MRTRTAIQSVLRRFFYLNEFRRVVQNDFNQSSTVWRGEISGSLVQVGMFTYGFSKKSVRTWGEGAQLQIGKFCSIADNVTFFLGGNHRSDWITTFPFGHTATETFGFQKSAGHPHSNGNIIIGNDVWIGSGATIMSGIAISNGAIIAANSHVVRDVGPYEIWGGNPARLIKIRFDSETIHKLENIRWWDFPIEDISTVISKLSTEPSKEAMNYMTSIRKRIDQNVNQ